MGRKRKYDAAFKMKVMLDALKEKKTLSEQVRQYVISPKQITGMLIALFMPLLIYSNVPRPVCPEYLYETGAAIKVTSKNIDVFYVAFLDSSVVFSEGDDLQFAQNNQEVEDWFKSVPESFTTITSTGDTIYYDKNDDYDRYYMKNDKYEEIFYEKFAVPDSLRLDNPSVVKCKDTAAYKIFGGLNPLKWKKAEKGEVILESSGFANSPRVIAYDPKSDWYYVSPNIDYGIKLELPESKNAEWTEIDWYWDTRHIADNIWTIICMLLTAAVEMCIAYIMGFRSRRNLTGVMITNLITNYILNHLIIGEVWTRQEDQSLFFFFLIIIEIFIIIIEAIVYAFLLKYEGTIRKRILKVCALSLLANLASLILGLIICNLAGYMFSLVKFFIY